MAELALSVVLPLADHRGFALASAKAWSGQTLAAGRYEVVAVDDGRDPRRSERVRRALRGTDRLVIRPGGNEIELYQAGADAARGELLLFTDSHAVPAPDAAEAMLRHCAGCPSLSPELAARVSGSAWGRGSPFSGACFQGAIPSGASSASGVPGRRWKAAVRSSTSRARSSRRPGRRFPSFRSR